MLLAIFNNFIFRYFLWVVVVTLAVYLIARIFGEYLDAEEIGGTAFTVAVALLFIFLIIGIVDYNPILESKKVYLSSSRNIKSLEDSKEYKASYKKFIWAEGIVDSEIHYYTMISDSEGDYMPVNFNINEVRLRFQNPKLQPTCKIYKIKKKYVYKSDFFYGFLFAKPKPDIQNEFYKRVLCIPNDAVKLKYKLDFN